MIEFVNVVKDYSEVTRALKGVSLQIEDGEFVFLRGPSGSGKTTMIKLITGELKPTSGTVHVNGYSMERIRKRELPYLRRTIGVVFQDFRLIANKTAYENLAFVMRSIGTREREIRERVPYVLKLMNLESKAHRYPREMSGGEQQRLAIARALVNNPSTIIADEPTGNLDPKLVKWIMNLLIDINNLGTTVVMVTHEEKTLNEIQKHLREKNMEEKRIIYVENGLIVSDTKEDQKNEAE